MKIQRILTGVMIVLLSFAPLTYAVDVLNKVDDLAGAATNDKDRKEGRHVILNYLAECEFSEVCILGLIYRMGDYNKKNPNPMVAAYVKFLDDEKQNLANTALSCRVPAKQAVRRAFAERIKQRIANENKMGALHREQIDKMRDEQDVCVKQKMEGLAQDGNIYAQATLVNENVQSSNQKEMNRWYQEMTKKQGTEEFNIYLKCTDIP